ncbi:MAG: thioredoxin-like protein [Desulfobaccales bacterium]
MPSIHVEIVYQGSHCPASFYMVQAVEEVLPLFGERVRVTKLEYQKNKEHSRRFLELSIALFGEKAVRNGLRLAPIPSLFINGKLVFDVIPARDDLEEAIEKFLEGLDAGNE